ncbi:hypothetical protein VaNZ11_012033, partial [Volvox africanus]
PSPSTDGSVNVESSPRPVPTPRSDTSPPSPPSLASPPPLPSLLSPPSPPSPSNDGSVNVENSPPLAPIPHYFSLSPPPPEKQTTLLLQRPPIYEVLVAAPPLIEEIGNARGNGTGNSSTQSTGGDIRFGSPPGAATGDGGTGKGSVAGAVVGGIGALTVLAVMAVGVLLRRKRKNFTPESGLMSDLMDEGPAPPALSAGPAIIAVNAAVASQALLDARP